jgi:TctA family transporter
MLVFDTSLRRALLTYHADFTAMLLRPVGLVLLALLILIIVSQLRSYVQRVQHGDPTPPPREA